ncbi:PH domain-containing protein [Psychromonas hadalis]|uniref:PH domain-containing protein n=1 Tax=Psychromonas hadalis TaxID=211669 RepID=UPI0003B5B888|nr:PH domain-containing protein [Psychromonas hadalis]
MKVFKSKVDMWLMLIYFSSATIAISGVINIIFNQADLSSYLSAFALLVVGAFLPLWILFSTHYFVDDDTLLIKSGPFKWNIAIASITNICNSQSLFSGAALSLQRLKISYGDNKSVLISPKLQNEFLAALQLDSK